MLLQITARPDAKLTADAVRHLLRRPVVTARIAGWVAIGLCLVVGDPVNYPLLLTGVVLSLVVPFVLINSGVRQWLRDAHLTTYEITDEGVASSNMDSRHAYAWANFTRVVKLPGQLIFAKGRQFLPVPTTGMSQLDIELVLRNATDHGLTVERA